MFSINTFVEIQVVGLLLLFGVSPLVILLNPSLRGKAGFLAQLDLVHDKSVLVVLILVIAFTLGIAANGLFTSVFEGLGASSSTYELEFGKWAAENQAKVKSLGIASYVLMERSEVIRNKFERRIVFIRVLRGAVIASLLFFISMMLYQVLRLWKGSKLARRYSISHFILTLTLLAVFWMAYWGESRKYAQEIFVRYTQLPEYDSKAK